MNCKTLQTQLGISYNFCVVKHYTSFLFFQPSKNVKIILNLWALQKQAMGWTPGVINVIL